MRVATSASTVSGSSSASSGLLADAGELLEEQRVARSALHQRGQLLVGQAPVACRCDGERLRVVDGKRLEPQRQCRERRSALGGREAALARPPRRAGEPRPRRKLRAEVAKELGGRVVHPVDVVEDDQRRRVEQVPEQRAHDAVQPRAPERGIEVVDLGRRLDLDVERRREQRRPGDELLVDRREAVGEHGAVVLAAAVQLDVEERAEERTERVVGRRRLVLLAAQRDLPHVGAVLAQLLREPRLPDPGSPTSSTIVPKPMRTGATDAAEDCALPLAVDERAASPSSALGSPRASAESSPSTNACTGSLFPFTGNGSSSVASKTAPPRANAAADDPDLVFSRAGHEARRERRRVAEHGVRPAEARADLAREDASLAHADVHRERKAGVDDRPHRAQHPLLVVAERLRRSGDEDDPTAVAVDVALEERHAVLVRGGLDRADERIERIGGGLGPFRAR